MFSVFYLLSPTRPGPDLVPAILGSLFYRPRPTWHEPFRVLSGALFRVHWPVYADLTQYKMSR